MALVYPTRKSGSMKAVGTVNLSTAVDGLTGADILDTGGLTLSGLSLSTLANPACTYSFRAGMRTGSTAGDGSTSNLCDLQYVFGTTGTIIMYGSTLVTSANLILAFDPAPFEGLRFIQVVSNTTGQPAANSAGAVARLILAARGALE